MCGIVGMYSLGEQNIVPQMRYSIHALNSRGQDACGIAVCDGEKIKSHKNLGLVYQVLTDEVVDSLSGFSGVAQVRYSTNGSNNLQNTQPISAQTKDGMEIQIAHNGDITNAHIIKQALIEKGVQFQCTSDTEVIIKLIAYYYEGNMIEAIKKAASKLVGSYSLVILTPKALYGVRDKHAIRPLLLGIAGDKYILASEPYAFNILKGGSTIRDLHAGEIIKIDKNGYISEYLGSEQLATCAFEYIYISHSSSVIDGREVFASRYEAGRKLAKYIPNDADLIVPVPETGIFAATGLHQETGIPYAHGLLKNRYSLRTFIQPNQQLRDEGVRTKLIPLASLLKGKDIILLDDSIVRGTTSKHIVELARECGSKRIHFALASPPLRHPCYWGVDMKTDKDFIALGKNREQIAKEIGADTVSYLSINDICEAIGRKQEDLCLGCFNGEKPTPVFNKSGILEL
jgi:amidophosphoribosyltransferase